MDGVFSKRRFGRIADIAGLLCGVFLALLFGFFLCIGEYSTWEDILLSCFFICFGLLIAVFCGVSLYVNQHAYIHVDEDSISAFCHFGLSLTCKLSDVRAVSFGYSGLNIQLHNNKKYNLMNLENAWELGMYIQNKLPLSLVALQDRTQMLAEIPSVRKKRNTLGIASIVCFLLLFPEIVLTGALTSWKDLRMFTPGDWVIFLTMAGAGIITFVLFCILLRKYVQYAEKLDAMQKALQQNILRTAPLQPGNVRKVFLEEDGHGLFRLTVFGFPNSQDVYFTVEQVDQNYEIECIHTSKIFHDFGELADDFADMTEIPLP